MLSPSFIFRFLSNQVEDVYTKRLYALSMIAAYLRIIGGCSKKALLFQFAINFCYSCIALGSLWVETKWNIEKEQVCGECYTVFFHSLFKEQGSLVLSSCSQNCHAKPLATHLSSERNRSRLTLPPSMHDGSFNATEPKKPPPPPKKKKKKFNQLYS